jgi:membrane protease YdiL (CAAX protease family)
MSEENNDKQNEEQPSRIKCDRCGATNASSNLFCSTCGHHFVEMVKCHKCNGDVPVFNTFCNHCGSPMKTERTIESQKQQQEQQSYSYSAREQVPPQYTDEGQFGYGSQYRPMTPDEAQRYQQQLQAQQLHQRNRTARYFGIFLAILGLIQIGSFLITIFNTNLGEVMDQLLNFGLTFSEDITPGTYYGTSAALYLSPGIILIIMGVSLIAYRPDNSAWKGFFQVIRYIFMGLVSLIALLIIGIFIFWTFYISNDPISGQLPFWLFTFLGIPLNLSTKILWIIFLLTFLVCIGLLIAPSIYKYVKDRKKVDSDEPVIEIADDDEPKLISMLTIKPEPLPKFMEHNEVELVKTRMPSFFYRIKNSSFIKTFELFGLMFLVSMGIALILTPIIPEEDLTPPAVSSKVLFALTTWAGISEEISFRLILIGIPMIFVVLIRYFIKAGKINMPSYNTYTKGTPYYKIKSRVDRIIDDKMELSIWDIVLAFRGKYKRVGYPEWVLIFISALLFGLAHWEGWTGSWGYWKIIHAGITGLFLGYAFVKYGIESAIILHLVNNGVTVIYDISDSLGFYGISGVGTFLVTSFSLLGIMKVLSEGMNLIYKFRIKKTKDLMKQY